MVSCHVEHMKTAESSKMHVLYLIFFLKRVGGWKEEQCNLFPYSSQPSHYLSPTPESLFYDY